MICTNFFYLFTFTILTLTLPTSTAAAYLTNPPSARNVTPNSPPQTLDIQTRLKVTWAFDGRVDPLYLFVNVKVLPPEHEHKRRHDRETDEDLKTGGLQITTAAVGTDIGWYVIHWGGGDESISASGAGISIGSINSISTSSVGNSGGVNPRISRDHHPLNIQPGTLITISLTSIKNKTLVLLDSTGPLQLVQVGPRAEPSANGARRAREGFWRRFNPLTSWGDWHGGGQQSASAAGVSSAASSDGNGVLTKTAGLLTKTVILDASATVTASTQRDTSDPLALLWALTSYATNSWDSAAFASAASIVASGGSRTATTTTQDGYITKAASTSGTSVSSVTAIPVTSVIVSPLPKSTGVSVTWSSTASDSTSPAARSRPPSLVFALVSVAAILAIAMVGVGVHATREVKAATYANKVGEIWSWRNWKNEG